jgi:hypothetical protein
MRGDSGWFDTPATAIFEATRMSRAVLHRGERLVSYLPGHLTRIDRGREHHGRIRAHASAPRRRESAARAEEVSLTSIANGSR